MYYFYSHANYLYYYCRKNRGLDGQYIALKIISIIKSFSNIIGFLFIIDFKNLQNSVNCINVYFSRGIIELIHVLITKSPPSGGRSNASHSFNSFFFNLRSLVLSIPHIVKLHISTIKNDFHNPKY